MTDNWQSKIIDYCKKLNIPLGYLSETLLEPKVVPMIRGKAFEFSVMLKLQKALPSARWEVKKNMLNAQLGSHDVDVEVIHKATGKKIKIECKLAGKGSYKLCPDGHSEIRVKCMRSRTLGKAMVASLAPKFGISESVLEIHNDQYFPKDFDFVVTSIGNAFYSTNTTTKLFEFKPTGEGVKFLESLQKSFPDESDESLQDFAFNKMYIARTYDIAITKENTDITCTRKACGKDDCGFIPNYPVIRFGEKSFSPVNRWYLLEDSETLFESFIKSI
jgi:hypothetical protein